MPFIRIINIDKHYSKRKKRIIGMAFRPSPSNGGISVIDKTCALRESDTICSHIKRYYPIIAGTPIVYWEVPDESIPPLPCLVEQTDGGNKDKCHHEFFNWDSENSEETIRTVPLNNFQICTDRGVRNLEITDLPN